MELLKRHIKIARLIFKQRFSDLEKDDNAQIDAWLEEKEENRNVYQKIKEVEYSDLKHRYEGIDVDKNWKRFESKTQSKKIRILPSLGIAASIAVIFTLSVFVYNNIYKESELITLNPKQSVRLVLGSGENIKIGDVKEGMKLASGNISVDSKENKLVYSASNGIDVIENNTLIVPRAGFYHLVLSDGTKVWLNSDTKLTYPVSFVGDKREVTLSGEAYFDVAHNKEKPFVVRTSDMDVRVLGTVFNVNTHGDNGNVFTVLVKGKVEVSKGNIPKLVLKPGQMAERFVNGVGENEFKLKEVDVSQYLAWKDGVFSFRGTSLSEILRKIERYYDVKTVYTRNIEEEYFTGDISRDKSLKSVLNVLELSTNVKFELKGKRIYIK